MATITFDTHKFITRLEGAGFSREQAEAVAEVFKDASGEAEVATRRDIQEIATRLEAKMDKTAADLKVDIFKWVTGALIAQAAVIATLVKLL